MKMLIIMIMALFMLMVMLMIIDHGIAHSFVCDDVDDRYISAERSAFGFASNSARLQSCIQMRHATCFSKLA